jgi:hypothetical protein
MHHPYLGCPLSDQATILQACLCCCTLPVCKVSAKLVGYFLRYGYISHIFIIFRSVTFSPYLRNYPTDLAEKLQPYLIKDTQYMGGCAWKIIFALAEEFTVINDPGLLLATKEYKVRNIRFLKIQGSWSKCCCFLILVAAPSNKILWPVNKCVWANVMEL